MSPIINLRASEKEIITHAYETGGRVIVAADTPEDRIDCKSLIAKGLVEEYATRTVSGDWIPRFSLELTVTGELRAKEELDNGFKPSD